MLWSSCPESGPGFHYFKNQTMHQTLIVYSAFWEPDETPSATEQMKIKNVVEENHVHILAQAYLLYTTYYPMGQSRLHIKVIGTMSNI